MIPYKASNPLINELFQIDIPLSDEMMFKLANLPRKELVNDLEGILHYTIKSYKPGQKQSLIVVHCLFLLTELESQSSLPTLLTLCEQSEGFLMHYLDDLTTEIMWQDILVLGKNNIDDLFSYIKDKDVNSLATCIVSDGLGQIALHYPELRGSIIDGSSEILSHLYKERKDYVIERDWIMDLIMELDEPELFKMVQLFFDDKRAPGYKNLNDFLKVWKGENATARPILTIRERYDHPSLPDPIFEEGFNEIMAMEPKTLEEIEDMRVKSNQLFQKNGLRLPPLQTTGRNELCPCGSGKKYKKCCIGNDM